MLKYINFFCTVLMCFLLLSACQKKTSIKQDWQPNVGPQTFYSDPTIAKSKAPMWVIPANAPQKPLKAVFFPFELQKKYDHRERISTQISRIFWKTWVGQGVFPALEFVENQPLTSKQAAFSQAQKLNADVFVSGKITDFMSGGSQGTTKIAFQVDIFTVPKGELIWSMEHAGRIENAGEKDYILFKIRTQMPSSPLYVLVNALAYDLAQPVKKWNNGQNWPKDLPALNTSY